MTKTKTIQVEKRSKSTEFSEQLFEELISDKDDGQQSSSTESKELLRIEYHVLYHISYAVPYLCFNAYTSSKFWPVSNLFDIHASTEHFHLFLDGTLLDLDGAWDIFNDDQCNQNTVQMRNVLTQMEHPILFKPFLTLHPCRTAEVLQMLSHSRNKVLSFLSSYGMAIYLEFDLKYAQLLDERLLIEDETSK